MACTVLSHAQTGDLMREEDLKVVFQRRAEQQARLATESQAFHGFQFSDVFASSNIRFTNHAVEDAGKYFKPAHYDHGTGVAAADVDGDGLVDLFFVNQIGGNGLWRNLGGGKFEDITSKSGVGLADKVCVTASFADIDNDGDPDLFITTVRMGNFLFENLGNGQFRDISREAGVNYSGHSSGAVFFDFDKDGLLDLFVCNIGVYTSDERGKGGFYRALPDAFAGHTKPERSERSLLYKNLGGGKFKEVSAELGLNHAAFSGDATVCDVNEDGFPDLYVINMQGDDHLYINHGGTRFEEKTASYFPKTPWGAMGVKFFDFNQDGLPDLFVTDMHSDMTGLQTKITKTNMSLAFEKQKSESWCTTENNDAYLNNAANNIFGNALYRNLGGGKFEEISDAAGAETLWPWGITVEDLNADGYPDVFVTAGMGFGFRYGINSVLLNDQGKRFVSAEFLLGIEPRSGGTLRHTAFVLDCSGADKDHPYCKGRSGMVPVSEPLSSRSSLACDLDNDGDLDLVVNEMNSSPQILMSNLAQQKKISYLKLKLVGTKSNRDGIGAVVKVTAGGKTWFQQHDGKSGYLAQSSLPLYFGLGSAQTVDKIEVHWPSGTVQAITADLKINSLVTVSEAPISPAP